jgi:hypothetical protein
MTTCRNIEFADCRLTDRSLCDVTMADFDEETWLRLVRIQLDANAAGAGTTRERDLRREYTTKRDEALEALRAMRRACATTKRDQSPAESEDPMPNNFPASNISSPLVLAAKTAGLDYTGPGRLDSLARETGASSTDEIERVLATRVIEKVAPNLQVDGWRTRSTKYLHDLAINIVANREAEQAKRDAVATVPHASGCGCASAHSEERPVIRDERDAQSAREYALRQTLAAESREAHRTPRHTGRDAHNDTADVLDDAALASGDPEMIAKAKARKDGRNAWRTQTEGK